ncbi:MAG: intradiol ring-cleavage dioxygenase [Solirubrobacteraceae bacterium]|nr:intradiol ring-cleavage dioxygenase [Solirubrobacteraceae bacterium]
MHDSDATHPTTPDDGGPADRAGAAVTAPDGTGRTAAVTRRNAVVLAGAAGAGAVLTQLTGPGRLLEALGLDDDAQAATAACVISPAKTEGPYFVDERLTRSDIRTDTSDGSVQPGVPLELTMVVVDSSADCAPIAGATVDVWHANAQGSYSDVAMNGTVGRTYLRGNQVTDADGRVTFTTIYPGWYQGRAIHIHFKVRLFDGTRTTYDFTSQVFFDPQVEQQVLATGAYASRGTPDTSNATDGIYGSDGARLLVALTGDPATSLAGTYVVGLSGAPDTTASGGSSGSTGGAAGQGGGDPGAGDAGGASGSAAASPAKVEASLVRAAWRRSRNGRRKLRLTFDVDEPVTVTSRITRSGRTVVRRRLRLRRGRHVVHLKIPNRTARGRARLSVAFVDADGATSSARRTVSIRRRA